MAFLSNSSSIFLLLVIVLRFSLSCSGDDKSTVDKICSKTDYPSDPFCKDLLNSRPGGAGSDLKSIAFYVLDKAYTNGSNTLTLVKSVIAKTSDKDLKRRYTLCSELYDYALDAVNQTRGFLNSGDYRSADNFASSADTYAGGCNEAFEEPTPIKNTLAKNNHDFQYMSVIIMIICGILTGQLQP